MGYPTGGSFSINASRTQQAKYWAVVHSGRLPPAQQPDPQHRVCVMKATSAPPSASTVPWPASTPRPPTPSPPPRWPRIRQDPVRRRHSRQPVERQRRPALRRTKRQPHLPPQARVLQPALRFRLDTRRLHQGHRNPRRRRRVRGVHRHSRASISPASAPAARCSAPPPPAVCAPPSPWTIHFPTGIQQPTGASRGTGHLPRPERHLLQSEPAQPLFHPLEFRHSARARQGHGAGDRLHRQPRRAPDHGPVAELHAGGVPQHRRRSATRR